MQNRTGINRNLYCEYIFYGRETEIVHIHFEYFDVEGFGQ